MERDRTPPARVSIARLTSYEPADVDRALTSVLEPLEGIGAFVPTGAEVVLKPNFLQPAAPERAVCTHPEVIRGVARLLRRRRPRRVLVTDGPAVGSATRVARRLGLESDRSLTVVDADDAVAVSPEGSEFRRLDLSRRIAQAEVLVNLPKAKTHGQMVLTGAAKNSFGAVVGLAKAQWHFRAGRDDRSFARLLNHVHALVTPTLNILDGVVGMEGNGPGQGDPRPLGLLMASADAHAIDATLARIWGLDAGRLPMLDLAREQGLLGEIEVVGVDPMHLRPDPPWKMARPVPLRGMDFPDWLVPILDRLLSVEPKVDRRRCSGCGRCEEHCAARAITVCGGRKRMEIDRRRCISCFCCQEVCPEGAIRVSTGPLARLLRLG